MATETDERSLAYAEEIAPDGARTVHYVRTMGRLDSAAGADAMGRAALCGAAPPNRYRTVLFVQVEPWAATCPACIEAAAALGGKVPVGS